MNSHDWRWKIHEASERLRTRYPHIGRSTGKALLALAYPPDVEAAALSEWSTLMAALPSEFQVETVDVLAVTQGVLAEHGVENVVDSLASPMPGSDPASELGHLWISASVEAVRQAFAKISRPKPIICLTRLGALHPAAGPHALMQALWDAPTAIPDDPVVVLIPGRTTGPRTYEFLGVKDEFMYRGDLL